MTGQICWDDFRNAVIRMVTLDFDFRSAAQITHSVKIEGLRQKKLYNGFDDKYLL